MSIITFGLSADTLVTLGYGGELAAVVEDALLDIPELKGRRPKITVERREEELYEEYCVYAKISKVNEKVPIKLIEDKICIKFNKLTNVNVVVKDISVQQKKNKNNEIVIEVKCLTPKQPKKFK